MRATAGVDSSRYEKIDENVFRMRPISDRPKRRVLTNFGRVVMFALGALITFLISIMYYLLHR